MKMSKKKNEVTILELLGCVTTAALIMFLFVTLIKVWLNDTELSDTIKAHNALYDRVYKVEQDVKGLGYSKDMLYQHIKELNEAKKDK